jgi:mono/diheme cytochrome c family protein
LDGLGSRKDIAYIRESLLDPQATIAESYPSEVSPMPPYGGILSEQEIEDLVSYLKSLSDET